MKKKEKKASKGRVFFWERMGASHHIMRERILRSPHLDVEVMEVVKTKQDFQIYIFFILEI
jgi:hypothetical protein